MDQNLTLTEQDIMSLYVIFEEFSVRKSLHDKLDAEQIKKQFRSQVPNFLKAMDEGTKNKLLNDMEKEMTFEKIWDTTGRMALEYIKKNSNALKD